MLNRAKKSNFDQRVKWLVDHSADWYDPNVIPKRCSKELVKLMKEDGLVAPSSYWVDVRMAPEIAAARKIVRVKRYGG